jgi:hypothetical protein
MKKVFGNNTKSISSNLNMDMSQKNFFEYVPLSNYFLPSMPAAGSAENAWMALKRYFSLGKKKIMMKYLKKTKKICLFFRKDWKNFLHLKLI